jgi:uncharacterized membrane protein
MSRALDASPLVMMYVARFFNVLTFVLALALSFRLAPGCRALITAVALMPMTLQLAGGISGDLVTIAFSFVGLSLVLHAREHPISRRYLLLVAMVFVLLALCKFSIWAAPLPWLIPASAFKNRRARLAYVGAVTVCMVAALMIWNGINSANIEALRAARLTHGIDMSANARLVSAHPFAFARQLIELVQSHYKTELRQFIGAFGWTQLSLPFWVRPLYLALLLFVAATGVSVKPFRAWERAVLLLVFLAGFVFVHAVIFVSDGTLCAANLERWCFDSSTGVQGRYLLPFCLAGFLTLRWNGVSLPRVTLFAIVTGLGALHALAALALIRSTFYL